MKKTVIEQLHEHQATAVAALADGATPSGAQFIALTVLSMLATQLRLWYHAKAQLMFIEAVAGCRSAKDVARVRNRVTRRETALSGTLVLVELQMRELTAALSADESWLARLSP